MASADAEKMTPDDISALVDVLGLTTLDLAYLTGMMQSGLTVQTQKSEIDYIALSILVRYLLSYPEENFLPEMPSFEEVLDLYETLEEDQRAPHRRLSMLTGNTSWVGYRWKVSGGEPKPLTKRLLYILHRTMKNNGRKGLERYKRVVAEECRARGINSLDELFSLGTWGPEGPRKSSGDTSADKKNKKASQGAKRSRSQAAAKSGASKASTKRTGKSRRSKKTKS